MDKIENCADCGKRFGFTERIFSKTNGLWICEDCNIKQIQENDNKDQRIAELEKQLAEYGDINNALNSGLQERCICCEEENNQDKISFAVEQLEKVKEKLEEDRNNAQALLDPVEREDYHELIGVVRGYRNSIYEVQKLIAEIKGERKE